ncbi:hypothetical protein OG21DRAFT_1175290 [Imleria badia]|nr:hypothetical protein OG21DRAFT_1175290 [Imleria badia]
MGSNQAASSARHPKGDPPLSKCAKCDCVRINYDFRASASAIRSPIAARMLSFVPSCFLVSITLLANNVYSKFVQRRFFTTSCNCISNSRGRKGDTLLVDEPRRLSHNTWSNCLSRPGRVSDQATQILSYGANWTCYSTRLLWNCILLEIGHFAMNDSRGIGLSESVPIR